MFQDTESGQEEIDVEGVFAESGLEVLDVEGSQEVDGDVEHEAHRLRRGAGADAAVVLAEHHIAHPEQPVLDGPAAAPPVQQCGCVRLVPRETGDGVLNGDLRFTVDRDDPLQSQQLSCSRPVERLQTDRRGSQCADLQPPTTLVPRPRHLAYRLR